MFSGASVLARFFEMLVSADFAAVYETNPGACRFVECAETLTMRAQAAFRRSGSAARMQRTAAIAPMLKCAKKSSSVSSKKCPAFGPIVLTRQLSSPQRSPTARKPASIWSALPRSTETPKASGLPARSSVATVSSRAVRPLAMIHTRAPSSARQSAAARPMPFEPPVTTAAAPSSPRSIARSYHTRAIAKLVSEGEGPEELLQQPYRLRPAMGARISRTSLGRRLRAGDRAADRAGAAVPGGTQRGGPFLYREGDYLGTSVNVAARLAAEAERHQLLVTAAVRKEAGGLPDVEFVPLGKRRSRLRDGAGRRRGSGAAIPGGSGAGVLLPTV